MSIPSPSPAPGTFAVLVQREHTAVDTLPAAGSHYRWNPGAGCRERGPCYSRELKECSGRRHREAAGGQPGPVEGNLQGSGAGLLPWACAAGAWSQLGLGLARALTQWQPVLGITKSQALTRFALGNPSPSSPKSPGIRGQRTETLEVTDPFGPGCLRPKACPLGLRAPGPPPQYRQTCSAGRLCSGVGRVVPLSPWPLLLPVSVCAPEAVGGLLRSVCLWPPLETCLW